jgi:long-chain acyl-CoA synthetase
MEAAEDLAMNEAPKFTGVAPGPMPAQATWHGVSMNDDLSQGPYYIDGADTVVKLFASRCAELAGATAHREKNLGIWRAHSWRDYWDHARMIGLGLASLGLKRGDVVSILSEDRKEWLYTDLGVQCMGGIVSGIYTTDSATQLTYLINDSDTRFLFLENDEQLDKYLSVRETMPGLVKVIVYDDEGLHGLSDEHIIFIDDLYALGRNYLAQHPALFEGEIAKSRPADIAVLIYTSGTTGAPKGAMITHENIIYGLSAFHRQLPGRSGDELVCFLPLSHIFERAWSTIQPIASRAIVNFAESPQTVFDNLREIAPHRLVGVPRVWEKLYSTVSIMVKQASPLGRFAYSRALAAGLRRADAVIAGKRLPLFASLSAAFWDLLVLRNIRRLLGIHRARFAASAAAPISQDVLRWFRGIGLPMIEGYGLTECSGAATLNRPDHFRLGTVGQAVSGMTLRLARDGEIQLKGANIFAGYWRQPARTAETLTEDGFLRTGDIGEIDAEGFLKITGRAKDIIITAGGKNITPAEMENRLKFSPYILDAVIIGDKRKFLTALVMIDQENVEKFAQDQRIPFSDFASLCAAPAVRELIGGVIEAMNQEFARVEQIKDFRIIDIVLTAEDDELTATMKLKRSFVERKYNPLIESMYKA